MADTLTTNLSLTKPEPGASADSWGGKLNDNFDDLDALFDSGPALKVSKGGTGATTASAARDNLGLGDAAVEDIVPVTKGGTGASTASAARSNLGVSAAGTLTSSWTVTESGGTLYFAYSGTNKAKLDSSGNLTVVGNVTAYGTM